MTITIHRGTHEIGGSCVELATEDSRLIIDIGIPLVDSQGEPFDMRPYKGLAPDALINEGVLPKVRGLYREAGAKTQ